MSTCTRPHIVVTGASSGIGRATALRLAAAGNHVLAGVRKPADGVALERAAKQSGAAGEITSLLLDVTDQGEIAEAARAVTQHAGAAGLAGLVNNAGIGVFGPLELVTAGDLRRQLEINVTGQLAVTQAFLPLLRQAQGRIVMIGSIGTRFTPPYVGALAGSKSALTTMAQALRQELAPWHISVIVVDPASVSTEAGGKLHRDAEQLLRQATPQGRALYQDSFRSMVAAFGAQHDKGSPPDVVARVIARALTASRPRPRYLTGRNSVRMTVLAAILPVRALDAVRRRMTRQPAPGSLVTGPAVPVRTTAGR